MSVFSNQWVKKLIQTHLEVIYIGVFLDSMSQQKLLRRFGQTHPELFAHHLTIWHFQWGITYPQTLPWGKTIPLKVIGHVVDSKAQAVIVAWNQSKLRQVPHITISTQPGIVPIYSNTLISKQWDKNTVSGLPVIHGKVGWFDGQHPRFESPPSTA